MKGEASCSEGVVALLLLYFCLWQGQGGNNQFNAIWILHPINLLFYSWTFHMLPRAPPPAQRDSVPILILTHYNLLCWFPKAGSFSHADLPHSGVPRALGTAGMLLQRQHFSLTCLQGKDSWGFLLFHPGRLRWYLKLLTSLWIAHKFNIVSRWSPSRYFK